MPPECLETFGTRAFLNPEAIFEDTLFCSFELDKFGELLQNPFLYLKLSTPQPVDSCAKSVKVSTYCN